MAIHWEKLALAVAGGVGGVGGKRDPAARRHRSASGGRMRISGSVDPTTVSALMKALAQGKRRR
jgi:hypothetical protein